MNASKCVLFTWDVCSVYLCAVFFGAPFFSGWYLTLLFALMSTLLNVTPRTMIGSVMASSGGKDDDALCISQKRRSEKATNSTTRRSGTQKRFDATGGHSVTVDGDQTVGPTDENEANSATAAGSDGESEFSCPEIDLTAAIADMRRYYVKLPNRLHDNLSFRFVYFIAAAAGAIVSPLDAENWWQYWPVPSFTLAIAVTAVSMLVPLRAWNAVGAVVAGRAAQRHIKQSCDGQPQ